jgi:hypothetical protein
MKTIINLQIDDTLLDMMNKKENLLNILKKMNIKNI